MEGYILMERDILINKGGLLWLKMSCVTSGLAGAGVENDSVL